LGKDLRKVKKNLKIPVFAFWIPARLADLQFPIANF